jgi:DNA-binding transcriptional LysR family regulator
VPLGELSDEAWIATVSARCNGLPSVTAACARAGFSPRFAIEADEFATTIGFVAAGLGVAMVPSLALTSLPENVFVAQIDGDAPSRRVFGVSSVQAAGDTAVKAMIDALALSAAPSLQAAS